MGHSYLKGRIFVDLATSQTDINCCQELFITISLVRNQEVCFNTKGQQIYVKVAFPFDDVEEEPAFILFSCNESTYRQM